MLEPTGYKHGRVSRRTTDLTRVMGARSTSPNYRKDDAHLVVRTTDGVVRCSSMISNKEDKGLRYGRPVTITIKAPAPLRSRGIAKSTTKLT
ncbi:hypothetical protein B296_00040209 [Ensete ventricosum]|uniref:Uncharacterized protein n=1 Tax=Ensete ventricosum TaxID=4639 RepID=A0A426X7P0_ENSVE|nr:hypothetical protein B296_00040209 [Ensete ventricosum]